MRLAPVLDHIDARARKSIKNATQKTNMKKQRMYCSPVSTWREEAEDTNSEDEFEDYLKKFDEPRLAWMSRTLDKSVAYQVRCFLQNRKYKAPGITTIASDANKYKNRYDDIPCVDQSRVILRGKHSDYIHANHVITPSGRRFICAQGPTRNTVVDFWHMILQENCRTILMLCNNYEGEVEKVANYCPSSAGTTFDICNIFVTLSSRKVFAEFGFTVSQLDVQAGLANIKIRHIHFTKWPDHSAPVDVEGIIELHRVLLDNPSLSPVLVHCSAGVGRTCTFVGNFSQILEELVDQLTSLMQDNAR
ncbi:hypothetical protein Y032_0191g1291 [Ancylostoma ceylanicum]|uniref:Protein-tyrosine phosphatase n=1 Tax=Ancylostoma ceylanicum TaxID=53326 RepID=A0A016SQQ7_9BILA|nr:hypothetical protein Y032_0191g1291 [Ancylostoma ceylanicum]